LVEVARVVAFVLDVAFMVLLAALALEVGFPCDAPHAKGVGPGIV